MKNPSFESDKDRWELERSGGDSLRSPFRNVLPQPGCNFAGSEAANSSKTHRYAGSHQAVQLGDGAGPS